MAAAASHMPFALGTRADIHAQRRPRSIPSGIPHADIISPNLHEAQTMYGVEDEAEIMRRMLADGCEIVALRMGELGSLVARQGDDKAYAIPAVEVGDLVDQTAPEIPIAADSSSAGAESEIWRLPAAMARRPPLSPWSMSAAPRYLPTLTSNGTGVWARPLPV